MMQASVILRILVYFRLNTGRLEISTVFPIQKFLFANYIIIGFARGHIVSKVSTISYYYV